MVPAREEAPTDVLVAGTGSLLHQAIINLVMRVPGIHVATITRNDTSELLQASDASCPDVVVLCEADPVAPARLFEILNELPTHEHLRVILIRQENNILEVYDKQSVELNHNANMDLITLIKDR